MAWTNEQLAAMQKNSGNLLLSAGAGSGKTAVLIERIMGIITDLAQPVDVDRLLVLTYTNAAAQIAGSCGFGALCLGAFAGRAARRGGKPPAAFL